MKRLLIMSIRVGLAVLWGRLRGRRRHPDWNLAQEISVTISLENGRRAIKIPPAQARAESEVVGQFVRAPKSIERSPFAEAGLQGEWFQGPDPSDRVILYFHGGGYALGSSSLWAGVLGNLAIHTRCRVLSVDYRLAPEHPFPAALDDAMVAFDSLLNSDIDPARIFWAGDSAGGGLVLAALIQLKQSGGPMPAGGILISPWVDLTSASKSVMTNAAHDWGDRDYLLYWARLYTGEHELTHPLISPAFGDLSGLPPLQAHVGTAELLWDEVGDLCREVTNRQGDIELKAWPSMPHGWLNQAAVFGEAAQATYGSIAAFIDRVGNE